MSGQGAWASRLRAIVRQWRGVYGTTSASGEKAFGQRPRPPKRCNRPRKESQQGNQQNVDDNPARKQAAWDKGESAKPEACGTEGRRHGKKKRAGHQGPPVVIDYGLRR